MYNKIQPADNSERLHRRSVSCCSKLISFWATPDVSVYQHQQKWHNRRCSIQSWFIQAMIECVKLQLVTKNRSQARLARAPPHHSTFIDLCPQLSAEQDFSWHWIDCRTSTIINWRNTRVGGRDSEQTSFVSLLGKVKTWKRLGTSEKLSRWQLLVMMIN